jgi:acyl-coenzyme A synthetase/AMP-(fatty) acid ligase
MLRETLRRVNAAGQMIWGVGGEISLSRLAASSSLERDAAELLGKSLVVLADDQLTAALALIELSGVARRLVLCPPDTPRAQIEVVIAAAEADAIVIGSQSPHRGPMFGRATIRCGPPLAASSNALAGTAPTEWALLTSGTTGPAKMVLHSLGALTASFDRLAAPAPAPVWATFYDIRRYGGLQIFLRAILGGGSLVLSHAGESACEHLRRLNEHGVTHVSGTPSHWRRVLMSPDHADFKPRYVRLSGEIVDQAILDALRHAFPQASIGHAYASTEAGVAFEVTDGKEGFPAEIVGSENGDVELGVRDGALCIRSARTASRYLGREAGALKDERGFVLTRDMIERRGDRFFFVGRGDGVVNVGGLKVHPEEVEAVINRHKDVRMSLVRGRRNPITGEIVVADVVLRETHDKGARQLREEIVDLCGHALDAHKIPASIRFVDALAMSPSGKLARHA